MSSRTVAIEARSGQPVLCLDPGDCFGTIGIFEPAIRIGDANAVIVIGDVRLAGRQGNES